MTASALWRAQAVRARPVQRPSFARTQGADRVRRRGLGHADARHAARRQRRRAPSARNRRDRPRDRTGRKPSSKAIGRRCGRAWPSIAPCPSSHATRKRAAASSTDPGFDLLTRFKTFKDDVLRFLVDFDVPFTNNLAEQDIRMTKVKMKISGALRHPGRGQEYSPACAPSSPPPESNAATILQILAATPTKSAKPSSPNRHGLAVTKSRKRTPLKPLKSFGRVDLCARALTPTRRAGPSRSRSPSRSPFRPDGRL